MKAIQPRHGPIRRPSRTATCDVPTRVDVLRIYILCGSSVLCGQDVIEATVTMPTKFWVFPGPS